MSTNVNTATSHVTQSTKPMINECSASFRSTELGRLAFANLSQADLYAKQKNQAENVAMGLLKVARGIHLSQAPDNFDELPVEKRVAIGGTLYAKFVVELEAAEKAFAKNYTPERLSGVKCFDKGGNWYNTRSKIKQIWESGYNIAAWDEHGSFLHSDLAKTLAAAKKAVAEATAERIKEEEEKAALEIAGTPQGKVSYMQDKIKAEFCALVDGVAETSQSPEQALKRLVAVDKWLSEQAKFFEKFRNALLHGKMITQDTIDLIDKQLDEMREGFISKQSKTRRSEDLLNDNQVVENDQESEDIPVLSETA